MKKTVLLASIGVLAIFLISGCVTEPGTAKDTLVLQIEEEIITLDNRVRGAASLYDSQVCYQIYGYLGMIAPGETIVTMPGIAESWSSNEDGTEWTFKLREGLTFHDGTPITAEDIEYSWKAARVAYGSIDNTSDPAFANYHNFTYSSPDALEFTVTTAYGEPDPMFEFDFCGQWQMFSIVPKDSYETAEQQEAFARAPVSCGPYMFKEWAQEDYILLERFDDWFGWGQTFTGSNGQSYTFPTKDKAFKYIKYRFIPEKAMALVELRTGGVDVTTGRFSDKASLEAINSTEGFYAYQLAVLGGASMKINHQGDWPEVYGGPGNFPCNQIWFKRALSHAINRTNMVENVYLGIADERESIFSDWILEKFPSIDTSDYYDFTTDLAKAAQLLDDAGYTALGFADEPDNRFGWGPYKNETVVNGVEQTKGYHFTLTTMDCDFCVKRALAIKKDLKEIGIYVDAELLEWGQYLDKIYSGTPGYAYNTSYIALGQQDPNFVGPNYDFTVGGFGGNYETPWDFIAYKSFAYWYFYGMGGYSWLNEDYEVGYAMATGGTPGFGLLGGFGIPGDSYPVPEWSDDDTQFIDGCEQAGKALAEELPEIPIVWYVDTYAMNDHLKNFLAGRNSMYMCAYAYWG